MKNGRAKVGPSQKGEAFGGENGEVKRELTLHMPRS